MVKKRETAGALALKAASDSTKYNKKEVAIEGTQDIGYQLQLTINTHNKIFDEDEYCVGFVYAGDPLIRGVKRRKFFAMLYLPSPRPEQTIFLYSKKTDTLLKRLWALPDADAMAILSESKFVVPSLKSMKEWSDAFFEGRFWNFIRKQHNIKMLSEHEYLNANREKFIEAGCQEVKAPTSESFDFSKVTINKIVDTNTAIV